MAISTLKRLKLISWAAYHMGGGWQGQLLGLIELVAFLGLVGGLIIDPMLRWIGRTPKDYEPTWFIIACAIVLTVMVLIETRISSLYKKSRDQSRTHAR